jgi:hypothetical protein
MTEEQGRERAVRLAKAICDEAIGNAVEAFQVQGFGSEIAQTFAFAEYIKQYCRLMGKAKGFGS